MSSKLAISLVIGASVGGAIAALRDVKSHINQLKESSKSLSDMKTIGSHVLDAAANFTLAGGAAASIGTAVVGLAKPTMKFESAMADVKKVVDFESPEGLKNLSNDILELTRTIPMLSLIHI